MYLIFNNNISIMKIPILIPKHKCKGFQDYQGRFSKNYLIQQSFVAGQLQLCYFFMRTSSVSALTFVICNNGFIKAYYRACIFA